MSEVFGRFEVLTSITSVIEKDALTESAQVLRPMCFRTGVTDSVRKWIEFNEKYLQRCDRAVQPEPHDLRARILNKMIAIRPFFLGLALLLRAASGQEATAPAAPLLSAEAIMARVAANQDRSEADRSRYLYLQHARVYSRKGTIVMCEEVTESRVTPTGDASRQELLSLKGRYLRNHKYVTYTTPLVRANEKMPADSDDESLDIEIGGDDRGLVEAMRYNFINGKSKDGIGTHLFPLTSKSQSDYVFNLIGREHVKDRDVFHLEFRPKEKGDYGWKGDAYIDASAYQPVVVSTAMSRKVPFAVRTLLGTNLRGLGFTVAYAPQPDGLWFPVSFGTEFKIHVLFFYSREIVIDVQNRDFEKTHVESKIVDGQDR